MTDSFIKKIEERLQQPLPGQAAQMKMAPHSRRGKMPIPDDVRLAGVMAALFQKENAWHVIFIERNPNDKDQHGGQISFPGGKAEPEDGTMLQTALRETEEEVGILQNKINVLGALSELYIPVSNFQVFPFVGYLDQQPVYKIQESEVSQVIETPLSHFADPTFQKEKDIRINKYLTLKNVPYYEVEGKILWGATAMMMSELVDVIESSQKAQLL